MGNPQGRVHFFPDPIKVIAPDPKARLQNDYGMGVAACGRVVEGIIPLREQFYPDRFCKRCEAKVGPRLAQRGPGE